MDIYLRKIALLAFLICQMCVASLHSSPQYKCIYTLLDFCWFWWNKTATKPKWTQKNKIKWNEIKWNHISVTWSMPIWPIVLVMLHTTKANPYHQLTVNVFPVMIFLSDNFISFQQNDNPFHFISTHYFFFLTTFNI